MERENFQSRLGFLLVSAGCGLLSCINRRGKIIIPSGNDAIEKGDTVIVVTTADRFINDLNDILDEEKGLL